MIKIVAVLTFVIAIGALVILKKPSSQLISGNVVPTLSPTESLPNSAETLGLATSSAYGSDWNVYTSKKLRVTFKYFDGVKIKESGDGKILITKDLLDIEIAQYPLASKDTVNTIAEQDANLLQEKLGEKFELTQSISPIAIGLQTGVTFSFLESGKSITNFYVPQGFTYLKIANKTVEGGGSNLVSLSDDIIYSLQPLEN